VAHGHRLSLDRPRIMGILNVTPDSFSDGGEHEDPDSAVARALEMRDEGASIIDVGGESTRPGAKRIDEDEQIARTAPVIERLIAGGFDGLISIDTTRARVARAAVEAGAHIVNDVSSGTDDEGMLSVASETGAGIVLMHRLLPPEKDSFSHAYAKDPVYEGGVVACVCGYLKDRADAALRAGVAGESIVLDPGLGFGKSVAQNYTLIAGAGELLSLGYPVLSAASRKSFIGAVTGVETASERLEGSLAVTSAQCLSGVRLFRVHDVLAHARVLAVCGAIAGRTGSVSGTETRA
jgi:dihydropteroate synthase